MNNQSIESIVMHRVRAAHALRPLLSASTVALAVFLFALWGIGREVWVAHVFQNAPSITNVAATARFWMNAFLDTKTTVQALLVAAFVALVWFFRDLLKGAVLAPSLQKA